MKIIEAPPKNEITRLFDEIMDERNDPDFKERMRLKRIREERLNKADLGI